MSPIGYFQFPIGNILSALGIGKKFYNSANTWLRNPQSLFGYNFQKWGFEIDRLGIFPIGLPDLSTSICLLSMTAMDVFSDSNLSLWLRGVWYAPWLLRDRVVIGFGPEDSPVTMTVKCLKFFLTMTVIVTLNGPIFQAILANIASIGRYPAILR